MTQITSKKTGKPLYGAAAAAAKALDESDAPAVLTAEDKFRDEVQDTAVENYGVRVKPGFHLTWWPLDDHNWGQQQALERDLLPVEAGDGSCLNPTDYTIDEHGHVFHNNEQLYGETDAHWHARKAKVRAMVKRTAPRPHSAAFDAGAERVLVTSEDGQTDRAQRFISLESSIARGVSAGLTEDEYEAARPT
jgi:hypothetical protein